MLCQICTVLGHKREATKVYTSLLAPTETDNIDKHQIHVCDSCHDYQKQRERLIPDFASIW